MSKNKRLTWLQELGISSWSVRFKGKVVRPQCKRNAFSINDFHSIFPETPFISSVNPEDYQKK